jgi:hypothetical protein
VKRYRNPSKYGKELTKVTMEFVSIFSCPVHVSTACPPGEKLKDNLSEILNDAKCYLNFTLLS